jgi:hypothetical protein
MEGCLAKGCRKVIEPELCNTPSQGCAAAHAKLSVHSSSMHLDRAARDTQAVGNDLVEKTAEHELQHLLLTVGKRRKW